MEETKNFKNDVAGLSNLGIYVVGLKTIDRFGNPVTIYDEPFIVPELSIEGFIKSLVNTPNSPYYYDTEKFLFKLGVINSQTCEVKTSLVPEVINVLSKYVSQSLRKYQQTLQTLNFTPQGYYKKSEAEKKEIQERLDDAILTYVEKYVIPEIDVQNIDKQSQDYKDSINKILSLSKNGVNS